MANRKKTIFSPKGGYSGYSGWALKYGDMCLNLRIDSSD